MQRNSVHVTDSLHTPHGELDHILGQLSHHLRLAPLTLEPPQCTVSTLASTALGAILLHCSSIARG